MLCGVVSERCCTVFDREEGVGEVPAGPVLCGQHGL